MTTQKAKTRRGRPPLSAPVEPAQANPIAALNDAMRRAGPRPPTSRNQWVFTPGITKGGNLFANAAILRVKSYVDFTVGEEIHGEHNFGMLIVGGERVLWKIDYYDLSLKARSPDPADPTVTRRVLTVMLAHEY